MSPKAGAAVYFDVGGVLIEDRFGPFTALPSFQRFAQIHPCDPIAVCEMFQSMQTQMDCGQITTAEFCDRAGLDFEVYARFVDALHVARPQVVALIERLQEYGYRIGLATNFSRDRLDPILAQAPCLQSLTVCCSSEIGAVKPARDFFERAQALLPSPETYFIDDRPENVYAACGFGWNAVLADLGDLWIRQIADLFLASEIKRPV